MPRTENFPATVARLIREDLTRASNDYVYARRPDGTPVYAAEFANMAEHGDPDALSCLDDVLSTAIAIVVRRPKA